jgi:hypothetical protein
MSRWGSEPGDRLAPVVIAVATTVLAVWIGAALLMSSHGFDLSDEGYYVLSYRWWDSTPRTVTGVQYLYGPVFELFGYDVRALRVLRLVTIVGAHAVFAWAFITWLRSRDRGPSLSVAWCWAWGLAIVASGGITYGRLPLSPGYNDVSVLASLLLAAAMLRTLVGVSRDGGALPAGPAFAVAPLAIIMFLAKWSSAAVVVLFIAIVAVGALRGCGPLSRVTRFVVTGTVSLVLTLVVANAAMGGFGEAIPPMLRVNRLVADQTNSPTKLLSMYASTGFDLLLLVVLLSCAPLILVGMAWLLRHGGVVVGANISVLLAPPSVVGVATFYLPGKGLPADVARYTSCLCCLALIIGATVAHDSRERSNERPDSALGTPFVAILLLGLPLVQALGTGNPVFALAIDGFAAWTALFVLAATRIHAPLPRVFVHITTVCSVVVAALAGGIGLMNHPYRTAPLEQATTVIGGSGPAAHLQVAPSEARRLEGVRAVLVGIPTQGRPMMAFDELPGLIAFLDGRSVGETWYSASDRKRSAANITDACHRGNPWGKRQPIIFYNRRPGTEDLAALHSCDIDLFQDYRAVQVRGFKPPLTIYIPERGHS